MNIRFFILISVTLFGLLPNSLWSDVPDVVSPLVSYHFHEAVEAVPGQPNVVSPLVSYHFYEAVEAVPDQPNVISPLVSYHFYEWPGDENLTFTHSQPVSYFYPDGALTWYTGKATTPEGLPVGDADVVVKRVDEVFWEGTTDANGYFRVSGLGNNYYTLIASKPGYITSVSTSDGRQTGLHSLEIILSPLPTPPELEDVVRTPEETAVRSIVPFSIPDHLRVFDGTNFVDNPGLIDSNRMTVVISHGWNSGLDTWTRTLAHQIYNHHGLGAAGPPNIIGWDWSEDADALTPPIDLAVEHGVLLGKALHLYLGSDYDQKVHFIGHSLGAVLNAFACNYTHGSLARSYSNPAQIWNPQITLPQATLLDEASVASANGDIVHFSAFQGWKLAGLKGAILAGTVATTANWRSAVPKDAAWIDNYISAVALMHDEATNVTLLAPLLQIHDLTISDQTNWFITSHGYSYQFYINSIQPVGVPPAVGFLRSAASGAQFPPNEIGLTPGDHWFENIDTAASMDLSTSMPDLGGIVDLGFSGHAPIAFAGFLSTAPPDIQAIGEGVLKSYDLGIQWAGEQVYHGVKKVGDVSVEVKEKIGLGWDAAMDKASNVLDSINPVTLMANRLGAGTFRFSLKTSEVAPQAMFASFATATLDASPSSDPAPGLWITVEIPSDAHSIAFDVQIIGDPVDDRIQFAVNGMNLFSLAASLMPDEEMVSLDPIPIRDYAGQTVELYFGLTGGTSAGCQLDVEGLRFVVQQNPSLALTKNGVDSVIQWPAGAPDWTPQVNTSLDPLGWQDLPLDTLLNIENGKVNIPTQVNGKHLFYRLKKNQY